MNTIVAISTPPGTGGIALVRLSGADAIAIADRAWRGASLANAASHTAHFGRIVDPNDEVLDEAVATIFRAPRSFTGEDTVEISVHGSKWIQRRVVESLMAFGAAPAEPGEFTRRAFMNGRMDLSQAEAVADLIASSSRAAHRLAMSQMSGAFSRKLDDLRGRLVNLASLLELELDFSEEDVTFADRSKLLEISDEALAMINRLTATYDAGRALKEGVPVAIAGAPNAGKSTLLNRLLDDDKAIVSDIPGTTRDIIEDTVEIGGILFRLFDTAGLRDTDDPVETIGIDRARRAIDRAAIVLWLVDSSLPFEDLHAQLNDIKVQINTHLNKKHLVLLTKSDLTPQNSLTSKDSLKALNSLKPLKALKNFPILEISAKEEGRGIVELQSWLVAQARAEHNPDAELIVTNARHQAALLAGVEALQRAKAAIESGISADFIAQDIREALHHLATLTGAITTDTLLHSIFSTFCIGK